VLGVQFDARNKFNAGFLFMVGVTVALGCCRCGLSHWSEACPQLETVYIVWVVQFPLPALYLVQSDLIF
jgi:hypothetical protein